jgi:hypothetical protein
LNWENACEDATREATPRNAALIQWFIFMCFSFEGFNNTKAALFPGKDSFLPDFTG